MISVAIPAYKPQFLAQAIESVLSQTYPDFELIIVNDASPFELKSIVDAFADPRIRYYENTSNIGGVCLADNWNKCLEYAKGELFLLFSDDDLLHRDFLFEMNQLAEKYTSVDLFHCRVSKINEANRIIGMTPTCPDYENVIEFVWHSIKGHRNLFVTEFLIRTEALKKIGGFYKLPLAWGSDYATWSILAKNNGIRYLNKPLCSWRSSGFNISNVGDINKRMSALESYKTWLFSFLKDLKINHKYDEFQLIECLNNLDWFITSKKIYLIDQYLTHRSVFFKLMFLFRGEMHYKVSFFKVVRTVVTSIISAK